MPSIKEVLEQVTQDSLGVKTGNRVCSIPNPVPGKSRLLSIKVNGGNESCGVKWSTFESGDKSKMVEKFEEMSFFACWRNIKDSTVKETSKTGKFLAACISRRTGIDNALVAKWVKLGIKNGVFPPRDDEQIEEFATGGSNAPFVFYPSELAENFAHIRLLDALIFLRFIDEGPGTIAVILRLVDLGVSFWPALYFAEQLVRAPQTNHSFSGGMYDTRKSLTRLFLSERNSLFTEYKYFLPEGKDYTVKDREADVENYTYTAKRLARMEAIPGIKKADVKTKSELKDIEYKIINKSYCPDTSKKILLLCKDFFNKDDIEDFTQSLKEISKPGDFPSYEDLLETEI